MTTIQETLSELPVVGDLFDFMFDVFSPHFSPGSGGIRILFL